VLIGPLLAALLTGCNDLPAVFEDVGADLHAPRLTLLGVGVGVPEVEPEPEPVAPAGAGDSPRAVTFLPPDAVVTVRPYQESAKTLVLRVAYADAGADLSAITVRDLDGPNGGALTLPDFPGTSGTIEATLEFAPASVPGPHRIELWAEDEHGSRSEKTTFTVVVEIF
jgi:hypothetical protein